MLPSSAYRDRLEIAAWLAEEGYGVEDLMTSLNLSWSDARRIVFGR
jgi:hypothetical protein